MYTPDQAAKEIAMQLTVIIIMLVLLTIGTFMIAISEIDGLRHQVMDVKSTLNAIIVTPTATPTAAIQYIIITPTLNTPN